jgi:hypothetical protein
LCVPLYGVVALLPAVRLVLPKFLSEDFVDAVEYASLVDVLVGGVLGSHSVQFLHFLEDVLGNHGAPGRTGRKGLIALHIPYPFEWAAPLHSQPPTDLSLHRFQVDLHSADVPDHTVQVRREAALRLYRLMSVEHPILPFDLFIVVDNSH